MSYKTDKTAKQLKERHQVVLNDLLREEANRYCADCEAKGPRWASWNLGVFLCIRCAGIHRNLGVHISRVKSVNLDSWTAAQIESIQQWGNKRAKEYYECYLPNDFVRPQGDSAMETLIRNKYERKLYIRKGGEPPQNKIKEKEQIEQSKAKLKEKQRENQQSKLSATAVDKKPQQKAVLDQSNKMVVSRPHAKNVAETKSEASKVVDLLGIDTNPSNSVEDEFSLFMSAADTTTNQMPQSQVVATTTTLPSQPQNSNPIENGNSLLLEEKTTVKKNTKESILSLYQSGNQQQKQVFGVPGGVYMPQQSAQGIGFQGQNQPIMGSQHPMQMNQNLMGMNQLQYGGPVNQQQNAMRQNVMGMNQNSFGNLMNVKMANSNVSHMQPTQPVMPNMMAMQNQMQNMNLGIGNQPRNQFYNSQMMNQNTMPGNLGQTMMANSYGPNRPMMPSQQPILVNGPSVGMGFANSNMGMTANMGNTLNNQLWK